MLQPCLYFIHHHFQRFSTPPPTLFIPHTFSAHYSTLKQLLFLFHVYHFTLTAFHSSAINWYYTIFSFLFNSLFSGLFSFPIYIVFTHLIPILGSPFKKNGWTYHSLPFQNSHPSTALLCSSTQSHSLSFLYPQPFHCLVSSMYSCDYPSF